MPRWCLLVLGWTLIGCSVSSGLEGALPDGTSYVLKGEPTSREDVTGVHAVITVDLPDGTSPALGIADFLRVESSEEAPHWDQQTLIVPAGDWTVRIDVYEEVLRALGPEAETVLPTLISGRTQAGLPVLSLVPPLRFADDLEVPSYLEVTYESFTVRRGCDIGPSVVCSGDKTVQAASLSTQVASAPDPMSPRLSIETGG